MFIKILKTIGKIIGGICLGAVIAFLFGWLVRLLWNWLMPDLFGFPVITFWQAWGLVILSHILFKAGGPPHGGHFCGEGLSGPPWKNHFRKKIHEHLYADKNEGGEKAVS